MIITHRINHRMRPPQGDWLGLWSQYDRYCPKKDSSLSCSDCSLDLKMFNDDDSTIDGSSRFQNVNDSFTEEMLPQVSRHTPFL